MKALSLLLIPLLSVAPMHADAHHARQQAITYRITDAPLFTDGPEGVCFFSGTVAIETLNGSPLGSTTLCVQDVGEELGPPYRFIEYGELLVELTDGALRFDVTFTDTYNTDQTAAAHQARGTVSRGTGRYSGVSGTLRGFGVILFDPDGTPMPMLIYHVRLTAP